MTRRAVVRWVFGAAGALFLVSGLLQLSREFSLGWAAVISAALIAIGLAVVMKSRWGGLIATWGVIIGVCWLLALFFGIIGRGYDFPYAGLGPGIGIATISYWQEQRTARADSDTSTPPERPESP